MHHVPEDFGFAVPKGSRRGDSSYAEYPSENQITAGLRKRTGKCEQQDRE